MLINENLQEYNGYEIIEKNGKCIYMITKNSPLNVIVQEKGDSLCKCGGKLAMLIYVHNDGIVSNKISGKKCTLCGRNYFTPKTVKNKEQFFNFCSFEDFVEETERRKLDKSDIDLESDDSEVLVSNDIKNSFIKSLDNTNIYYEEKNM